MSAGPTFSLASFRRPPPRMILGWTPWRLRFILLRAAGRIGLRRSATRAPGGRLYARRPGLPLGGSAFVCTAGVGRQSAKLRGFGGRAPKTRAVNHLVVLQVVLLIADCHRAIQSCFNDDAAASFAGIDRRLQLIEAVVPADGVVVGHDPLLLDGENRCQVEGRFQGAMRVATLSSRLGEAAVVVWHHTFQDGVGFVQGSGSGQTEFLHPAILSRAERTLDASFRQSRQLHQFGMLETKPFG